MDNFSWKYPSKWFVILLTVTSRFLEKALVETFSVSFLAIIDENCWWFICLLNWYDESLFCVNNPLHYTCMLLESILPQTLSLAYKQYRFDRPISEESDIALAHDVIMLVIFWISPINTCVLADIYCWLT